MLEITAAAGKVLAKERQFDLTGYTKVYYDTLDESSRYLRPNQAAGSPSLRGILPLLLTFA
jgi:hypothetical protein